MDLNVVVLGGFIRALRHTTVTLNGQPILWVLLVSKPTWKNHYGDPFAQWIMTLGETALMLERNARPGRTLVVHGVIRNTKKKAKENEGRPMTYVKAKFVSFGDHPNNRDDPPKDDAWDPEEDTPQDP